MNEKIKWFGRYLGCKTVWIGTRTNEIVDTNILTHNSFDGLIVYAPNRKLILIELSNISEDDLKECAKLGGLIIPWDQMYHTIVSVVKYDSNALNLLLSSRLIDKLRELGYACGIPKEYYITESELKEGLNEKV